MRDRDSWLNATMIELADSGQAELDEAVYIGNFTDRLAELLGPVEVGLLLPEKTGKPEKPDNPQNPEMKAAKTAGSGELAAGLARLEADGETGPCLTCYSTGRPIGPQRLTAARDRWPAFTDAAIAAGLATCWALPLRRHAETIGAVSVLARSGHEIDSADFLLAQALTEMATIGILRQRELRQSQRLAGQLQRALDSRIVIEQAKGAVSARLGVTPNDAFELLRSYARSSSRPLSQVAGDVLAGTIPASALSANGRRPRRAPNNPAGNPANGPVDNPAKGRSGQGSSALRGLCCYSAEFA